MSVTCPIIVTVTPSGNHPTASTPIGTTLCITRLGRTGTFRGFFDPNVVIQINGVDYIELATDVTIGAC